MYIYAQVILMVLLLIKKVKVVALAPKVMRWRRFLFESKKTTLFCQTIGHLNNTLLLVVVVVVVVVVVPVKVEALLELF